MTSQRQVYEQFARAWAERDVEGCLALMSEDVCYGASVGPEPGRTYKGQAKVRRGIEAMFAHDETIATELRSYAEAGSTAFVEWRYRLADGGLVLGIDRIDFRLGKICRKEAYRKVQSD